MRTTETVYSNRYNKDDYKAMEYVINKHYTYIFTMIKEGL